MRQIENAREPEQKEDKNGKSKISLNTSKCFTCNRQPCSVWWLSKIQSSLIFPILSSAHSFSFHWIIKIDIWISFHRTERGSLSSATLRQNFSPQYSWAEMLGAISAHQPFFEYIRPIKPAVIHARVAHRTAYTICTIHTGSIVNLLRQRFSSFSRGNICFVEMVEYIFSVCICVCATYEWAPNDSVTQK